MPDIDFDALTTENDEDTPNMAQLRRALKASNVATKKAMERAASLEAKDRGREIAAVLKDKNFDPRVAGLIPADVEAEGDALTGWLTEHGIGPSVAPVVPAETPPVPGVDPTAIAAFAQMQATGHEGTPPAMPAGHYEQQLAKAEGAKTEQEFYQALGIRV